MVICFKCSPASKRRLDELLAAGAFADYSEVIESAIENMAVLQEEVQHKGPLIIGSGQGRTFKPRQTKLRLPQRRPKLDNPASVSEPVPGLFSLSDTSVEPPDSLAPLPTDVFFPGKPVPIDRWIFGQFNKLLPAKANCRALARMYPPPAKGFELDQVASRISQEAEVLGKYLAEKDRQRGLSRDDAWAVGFPSGDNKADRSRLRYANQFVGSIGRQGTVTGLLIDLKLINLAGAGAKRVLLTRSGWDFGVTPNPVLDGAEGAGKFTASEVAFLLEHIQQHVPVEDFAFRTILAAIRNGQNTPDKLDEACKQYVPTKPPTEISEAVITTQRTGAVSRMVDLGLITRRRDGLRVSYVVTDLGEQYADRTAVAQNRERK